MNEPLEELPPEPVREKKWYLRWWSVVVLLATIGPFAFPFLWKSKDVNLFWKWFLTVAISVLTFAIVWSSWQAFKIIRDQFQLLGL